MVLSKNHNQKSSFLGFFTFIFINLGISIKERYKEICGLECNLPEDGYHGKEIIVIAKNIFEEYNDTKLMMKRVLGNKGAMNRMVKNIAKKSNLKLEDLNLN